MKDYQYNYQYIAHLKKLSQIMNTCRQSKFLLRDIVKNSPDFQKTKSIQKGRKQLIKNSSEKGGFIETFRKWKIEKENLRLAISIDQKAPVLDLRKNQQDYKQHLKIRKLRSKFQEKESKFKQIKIIDIVWKGIPKNANQHFALKSLAGDILAEGDIEKISNLRFLMKKDKPTTLKLVGSRNCKFTIQNQHMIPLIHKEKIIGNIIIDFKA